MDFVRVIALLRPVLEECGARWAVAGGVALATLGSARTTYDLDLVVDDTAHAPLVRALALRGFEVLNDTGAFTNLLHADPEIGRVDLIWMDRRTSERLLAEARTRPGPDGSPLLVPSPEHLIEMKVQAIKNKPMRVFRDGADIQVLLSLPETDQNAARGIFARHGLAELYDRIRTGF